MKDEGSVYKQRNKGLFAWEILTNNSPYCQMFNVFISMKTMRFLEEFGWHEYHPRPSTRKKGAKTSSSGN